MSTVRRGFGAALLLGAMLAGLAGASAHVRAAPGSTGSIALTRGPVRLDGRALADDRGPFLALGASLFWALWGERHDPDRLDRNLAWLAEHGVDYVRILGMVGADSWSDRRIDPHDPDYWTTVDRLFTRLARHGLRAQVTIFADAQVVMPKRSDRQALADAWARRAQADPQGVLLLEVANEYRQNGLADVAELRALGRRLAGRTRVLVALSAPSPDDACAVYARSAADVATVHYHRSSDSDDPWLSVGEPWRWPSAYEDTCRGRLPVAINNEPIGPESSVQSDDDPLRLAMGYITTFVAGNAGFVLHAGAGIRGGGAADRALDRSANFDDTQNLEAAFAAIRRAREYLPGGLANWRRHDAKDSGHPFVGFDRAAVDAVYAATSRGRFMVVVLGAGRGLTVRARQSMTLEIHHPLSGTIVRRADLGTGDALSLDRGDAWVLTGSARQ